MLLHPGWLRASATPLLLIRQEESAGLSPIQSTSFQEDAMPKSIIKKFQDEYGNKHGMEVFYAAANKEGRDPETFHKAGKASTAKRKSRK
jgi:hypothetical protein